MQLLRPFRAFFALVLLLAVASLALDHINGRFWLSDFRVYYNAADNLRHGLPVYNEVFGEDTGLYKYAPVVLYFFLPYTWLPFSIAGAIHCLLTGVLAAACFPVIEHNLARFLPAPPKAGLRALLGLLCIAVLLVRELHLGNINMGLILLAVLGTDRLIAGQRKAAGILWGVVWLIKPYLLLMLVPLAIRKEWRVLRTAGATMAAGVVLPWLAQGPGTGLALTLDWLTSMRYHTRVMFSPDKLGSMLHTCTGLGPSTAVDIGFILLAGALLAWLSLYNKRVGENAAREAMDRSVELWLAMAMVPNLVVTDQQHFMFALPLVMLILASLFIRRQPLVLAGFLFAMLLYGTRSTDLWGVDLENRLLGWGVLGSGNILLIAVAWHTWRKLRATAGTH